MIQISDLHIPVDGDQETLRRKIAKLLSLPLSEVGELQIVKQSVDARKKDQIHLVCTVRTRVPRESSILRRNLRQVKQVVRREYHFPQVGRTSGARPVVVGMGPAGLFCALFLARAGIPCIVLERGKPVEERVTDVERFWTTGDLDRDSNVQFGEGGAGTFSDGKLTTGIHDPRVTAVFETFAQAGAPEDILYSYKPHIGTDQLRRVVANLRRELLALGCELRYGHRMLALEQQGDRLTGLTVRDVESGENYHLKADTVVLAVGHSDPENYESFRRSGLPMEQKPFAIGVRIEHSQQAISQAQFGPAWDKLPPSDYKLSCHLPSGRSAFTFCVCPGGEVVAAASEPGALVTNGMSYRARDGKNINGGFLVGVGPGDFGGDDPLAGVRFQTHWEQLAYRQGGGNFVAPAQLVGDFLAQRSSQGPGDIAPTYTPGVKWTDVGLCLPDYVTQTLRDALPIFDRKVRGFAKEDAVLTGVETRSSSPVRVVRDERLQSALGGVYPCGEGCGYAGGIVSAAVDGIRVAEAIARENLQGTN